MRRPDAAGRLTAVTRAPSRRPRRTRRSGRVAIAAPCSGSGRRGSRSSRSPRSCTSAGPPFALPLCCCWRGAPRAGRRRVRGVLDGVDHAAVEDDARPQLGAGCDASGRKSWRSCAAAGGALTTTRSRALRRRPWSQRVRWPELVVELGLTGVHFHDLRHAGNIWASKADMSTKDLMARMGHDDMRTALIYQRAMSDADQLIAARLSALIEEH